MEGFLLAPASCVLWAICFNPPLPLLACLAAPMLLAIYSPCPTIGQPTASKLNTLWDSGQDFDVIDLILLLFNDLDYIWQNWV